LLKPLPVHSLISSLRISHFRYLRGGNVARLLKRLNPELKAIILSIHDDQTVVGECFAAGVKGFALKRTAATDLLPA